MAKSVSSPVHPPGLTGGGAGNDVTTSPAADVAGSSPTRRRSAWVWLLDVTIWLALAAISYIPSFRTQPGMVAADTKQYLYLDPGRLIQSALSMWNPDVGAGTVTHQNIGYAFPMGPYYWLVHQLGVPMWVGQRFWMGTLFFAAGTGVLVLGRLLGLSRAGQVGAALMYMLTPYVIDYIARISAIVMPWAALGWLLVFTVLAVRKGHWRYPALFALVIALVGGVNATSVLLVGLAPLLWLLYAVFVSREATARSAVAAALRIGILSLGVSLWWMAGLWAEGAYGINVLKFTETLPTVSITSLSSEVLRGLGYWYFYGQDKLQPWTLASEGYTQWPWLIGVSFAVPALCFVMAMLARWRYRAFAVGLILVGTVLAVGAYPYSNPTPFGSLIKTAGSDSTLGLAMRSTNRIVPLVILGLALLLGAGLSALTDAQRLVGLFVLVLSGALVAANLPPLWDGTLVATNLERPETLPSYITDAAAYMNAQSHDTRVLELPGEDFAYYRWGVTADPVWPGLMTRPYLTRAAVPQGEAGSVNLLQALDESIEDGVFVPQTLVPIAGLLSAGDILYESDVQYERFNTARPQPLWLALNSPAAGLEPPVTFGTPTLYTPIEYPLTDETQLAIPTGASIPPPVAVFGVPNARPIVRTETPTAPLLVAGDGQGLVNAAAAGLLANNPTIFYSASYAQNNAGLQAQLARGAVLVLTDTNQKQLDTWGTVDDNYGYVETANETPLAPNPAESALPVFPGAPTSTQTVAELSQVASVRATAYGNPITNTPENRPFEAVDGDIDTAWTEGAFSPAIGATLQIGLTHPVTTDHITLLQPQKGARNRHVTRVTLTFDGKAHTTVDLGASSLSTPGEVVTFGTRTFHTLSVTVDATSSGIRKSYDGESSVGFAEVEVPGVPAATEVLRLPTDLLSAAGAGSAYHQLDIVVNRLRAEPVPPRSDPETTLSRSFTLPTARNFSIGGLARISTLAPDPVVNALLGRSASTSSPTRDEATVVQANSSGRLPGDLAAGASAAIDGNPATAWMPGLGPQDGGWVEYQLSHPITFDHLDLQIVADGRHSIPTTITVSTQGASRQVTLPAIDPGKGRTQGSVTSVPVQFASLSGSEVRVTVDSTDPVHFHDYISDRQNTEPIGLAEVGIPGVAPQGTPATIPTVCEPGLLAIDGMPIDVQISGTTATALGNGGLSVTGCGNSAHGITLSAGTHLLTTAPYETAGVDLDSLTLASAAGGGALPLTPTGQIPPSAVPVASSPTVSVLASNRSGMRVSVTGEGSPYWLVLGQSQNRGWHATTSTGVALGSSSLIDGYANGWYVPARLATGTTVFNLAWLPQRLVNVALLTSSGALAISLGLILIPPGIISRRLSRRRARREAKGPRHVAGSNGTASLALAATATEGPPGGGTDSAAPTRAEGAEFRPQLTLPLRSAGVRPAWYWAILIALASGLVVAAVVAPVVGLAIGALVLLGLLVSWSRGIALIGAIGLVVATGVYMVTRQRRYGFVPDINWPAHFPRADTLAWLAICVLAADAVVIAVRHRPRPKIRRRRRKADAADEPSPPSAPTSDDVAPLVGGPVAPDEPSAGSHAPGAAPDDLPASSAGTPSSPWRYRRNLP